MGTLTVASEGWAPSHCACYLQYSGRASEWLGFDPNGGLILASGDASFGLVVTSDQSNDAQDAISFYVDDTTLWDARMQVTAQYATELYCLGVNDCCTFAKNLCQACKLVTPAVALTPTTFLWNLRLANGFNNGVWDPTPRPWATGA